MIPRETHTRKRAFNTHAANPLARSFPNSIEVRTDDAQRYFFTSFLSREDAFRLMQLTLARHRPEGHANDTLDDSSTTPLCPPVSPSSRTSHDTAATGGQVRTAPIPVA